MDEFRSSAVVRTGEPGAILPAPERLRIARIAGIVQLESVDHGAGQQQRGELQRSQHRRSGAGAHARIGALRVRQTRAARHHGPAQSRSQEPDQDQSGALPAPQHERTQTRILRL